MSRAYYPIETRKEIVAKIDTEALTIKDAIEQGVPAGTLYSWIHKWGKESRQRLLERRERIGYRKKKRKNGDGHATVRVTQTGPEDGGTVSYPELIMAYRQAAATLLRAGFNKEFLISLT